MMRDEPREEDPKVNIMLWSGSKIGEDKGMKPVEGEWVYKAPEKETWFELECEKEPFMEEKKSFAKVSTSRSQEKLVE